MHNYSRRLKAALRDVNNLALCTLAEVPVAVHGSMTRSSGGGVAMPVTSSREKSKRRRKRKGRGKRGKVSDHRTLTRRNAIRRGRAAVPVPSSSRPRGRGNGPTTPQRGGRAASHVRGNPEGLQCQGAIHNRGSTPRGGPRGMRGRGARPVQHQCDGGRGCTAGICHVCEKCPLGTASSERLIHPKGRGHRRMEVYCCGLPHSHTTSTVSP
ncbi:hypothetical protein K438DRAFT_1810847 [Mycena galopus ATCC 62051]|nr:hypothetical protein K438DRAFT_1810847 [Mycena galopus ATCC 62051]